jgi:hypothetical protein
VRVVPPESRPETRGGGGAPAGPLPLPLRNRLAELILEAFEPGDARATLFALAAGCALDGSAVDARDADRLLALGWFEPAGPGRVRLRGAHRPHGWTLAERAGRAASMTREWRDRDAGELAVLLDRAAALANQGLFFEVHELLEPAWFHAAEPVRTALQGLIQIAVAFHHLENLNHPGARSLLAEGVAKVAETAGTLPLDAAAWLGELRTALAALARGDAPSGTPRWPHPGSPAPGRTP